jgi:hypothetical protein
MSLTVFAISLGNMFGAPEPLALALWGLALWSVAAALKSGKVGRSPLKRQQTRESAVIKGLGPAPWARSAAG